MWSCAAAGEEGMSDFPWTEKTIGRALAQKTFNRKYLVVVPTCSQ